MARRRFKPKVTKDREATTDELKCIEETEEMLAKEKKLPPASQMIRDLATTHWKSLKADEVNPDTNKKDGRCTHCGCFMNVKVHYAVAECPIGKWKKDCGCQSMCKCKDGDCDE